MDVAAGIKSMEDIRSSKRLRSASSGSSLGAVGLTGSALTVSSTGGGGSTSTGSFFFAQAKRARLTPIAKIGTIVFMGFLL